MVCLGLAAPLAGADQRIFAGSRIPIDEIPTKPGHLGTSKVVNQSKHVLEYPMCKYHNTERLTDKSFIIKQLVAAPTYTRPFNAATYFCGMLPQHIYTQLIENFPPDKFFENYENKVKSCDSGGCRYSLSAFSLTKANTWRGWQQFQRAKILYKHLISIFFSKEFEAALWKKLGIKEKVKRRELRILSDKHGFSNGRIHTDLQARKIATMMFYLPVTDVSAFDYGTCIHTTTQWKGRRIMKQHGVKRPDTGYDGEGDCYYKFRFLPNTGYSFKAGPASWHSAPNLFIKHYDEYDRNTLLLNWY